MSSVARGTLVNLLARSATVLLVLALSVLAARIGPSTQGAFALFTSVESLVIALASGPGLLLARQVSQRGQASPTALGAVVGASLLTGGAAGLAVAALAAWGPEAYGPLALLAWALPLVLLTPNLACLWLGAGRMLPMARLSLAPPLLALAAVLACSLLWPALSLGHLLGSWVAAKAGVAAGLLGWLWWRGRVALPSRAPRRAEWSFVAMLGLTNLVGMLNYRVGLFVVERQMGLDATGLYSIAVIAAELLWFVSGSLTQAAYSRIGSADPQAAAATAVRVAQLSLVALLLAAPVLYGACVLLVPPLLGAEFAASLPPLALLLPGVVLFGGASALSAFFTNHAGAPRVPAAAAAWSLAANGVAAWLLVPGLGLPGAALAASAAYALTMGLLARRFARHTGLRLRQVLLPGRQCWRDLQAVAWRR
jgi:O-antigen/teichoic acid export membrane protein